MALVVGAVLRIAVLDQKTLWCDELATLQRLELSFLEHVSAMKGNHPLYEILLRFWAGPDGSEAWVRIPSVVLGVFAVWLAWLLLRSVDRKAALFAAWLMALSPLHMMYSRIARAYSLACTLALLSNLALLWAVKRKGWRPLAVYALTTALMIYSNLLAGSIWVAQGIFLLWFYRRRWRRLRRWIIANAGVALLILPWMIFSLQGAFQWGGRTVYTAHQLGRLYKVGHVAMALCVGETVHPLNMIVVPIALVGFGLAMVLGARYVRTRRNGIPAFLLVQAGAGFAIAMYFAAASPKHVATLLPAWLGVMAVGLVKTRLRRMAVVCGALMLLSAGMSNVNYFTNKEFTDADMVTPWREMTAKVKDSEQAGEILLIGYRPDPGAHDMFLRYYRAAGGKLDATHLFAGKDGRAPGAWEGPMARAMAEGQGVWLLLHDGDPWHEIEAWMRRRGRRFTMFAYQDEEHSLMGLGEWRKARGEHDSFSGWIRAMPVYARKHRSPLYRLYYVAESENVGR